MEVLTMNTFELHVHGTHTTRDNIYFPDWRLSLEAEETMRMMDCRLEGPPPLFCVKVVWWRLNKEQLETLQMLMNTRAKVRRCRP
jgi:hypothetical protein